MAAPTQHKRQREFVNGVVLLNKPAGLTSNQALQKVKRLLNARKAGHTGSLDPAATGMLPLCFGEATKICAYLLDADKSYRVVARLGTATDTGDADGGREIASAKVPILDAAGWQAVLDGFRGEISQVPPMYSALKQDGKRLYELARQGQVVARAPRQVQIRTIELLEIHGTRLAFRVCCSKGTYVRTLVEDVARAAGTVAHTESLHREVVGPFEAADMVDLATLQSLAAEGGVTALREQLLPVDRALLHWPECHLPSAAAGRFRDGQPVTAAGGEAAAGQLRRVYDAGDAFLGVAESLGDGRIAPRRLIRTG